MKPDPFLTRFVVVMVTLAWTSTLVVGLFTRDYEPLIYATPLQGAVVGFATGIKLWKNGEGKL